jgi:hypothetical protein
MSGSYQDPYAPLFDPDGADFPAVYPNTQAQGVTNVSGFTPFELWAGEADIITSQGTAGANINQFQVLTVDGNGHWIPWAGPGGINASMPLFFTGVVNDGDTLTVNGNVITYVAHEAAENQIDIRSLTNTQIVYNTSLMINANQGEWGVNASPSGTTLVVFANEDGTAGNSIAVSHTGTGLMQGTGSGSPFTTLSGGTADNSAIKPYGFAAQAAVAGGPVPVYVGGAPNHVALGWPTQVASLDERKMAFLGTNIIVSALL